MASPPTLDLESLLQPISEASPTGTDLRDDSSPTSPYYEVKDVAKSARSDERRGLFDGVIGSTEADAWRSILDLGPKILIERSKDLEIASLMIEALARTHGFAGLRDGFRLARELVERFWDDLYPRPDEYGMETRVAPIAGLNGSGGPGVLVSPIARIAITAGSGDVGPFATWNVDQAVEIERLDSDKKAERIAAGGSDMEKIRQDIAATDSEFLGTMQGDIEEAIEEWKLLRAALEERAGSNAPPTSNVRGVLDSALGRLRHIAADRMPVAPEPEPAVGSIEAGGAENGAAPAAGAPTAAVGPIADREQAFKTLNQIADFFRRTEPHSPIPYLLERAVRWGRTPLPELLAELIPDQNARNMFNSLTGVDPTDPQKDQ